MNRPPTPDPVHGQLLGNRTGKRSGAQNNERAAVRSALEFVELCTQLDARYEDLDSWFVAWAAWTMDENLIFGSVEEIAACRRQREAQTGKRGRGQLGVRKNRPPLPVHHSPASAMLLACMLLPQKEEKFFLGVGPN